MKNLKVLGLKLFMNSRRLNSTFSTCNKYFSSYIHQSNLNMNMHRNVYQQMMTPFEIREDVIVDTIKEKNLNFPIERLENISSKDNIEEEVSVEMKGRNSKVPKRVNHLINNFILILGKSWSETLLLGYA